jgi:hypothetical protein
MDGRYGRIDENYYGHSLQNLIDMLLNQDYNKRPKASEIIEFVNSKYIPNEFQKHKTGSNNFRSQQIHNFTSNSPHLSNKISHRTHTIQENLNSISFNDSARNNFMPYDGESNIHSNSSMKNKPIFLPPPPIFAPNSMVHGSFNLHHMPQRSTRNFDFSHGQSKIGAPIQTPFNFGAPPSTPFNVHGLPPPSPLNVGPSPPPPNYFNTHGGPFHPQSSPFML